MNSIIDYINGFSYISGSFLNTVIEVGYDGKSNDSLYNDGLNCEMKHADGNDDGDYDDPEDYWYMVITKPPKGTTVDDWNESAPNGDNWGLEALCVPSAWDLVKDSQPVKVGIVDSYFEDAVYSSGEKELEFEDILRNIIFDPKDHGLSHGDHVAGIIGAKHNNKFGISGVATKARLYGYTWHDDSNELSDTEGINVHCIAGEFVALNALICNHVKVINMSLGYGDGGLVYAASHGNLKAKNKIDEDARIAFEHLRKLTDAGYDFLIVKSVGNYNNVSFIADNDPEKALYGYREIEDGDDKTKAVSGGIEARYGYYINNIRHDPYATNPKDRHEEYIEIEERIIDVGSFNKTNAMSAFSGTGIGVDVLAPGEDIVSTVPRTLDLSASPKAIVGYKLMSGTSMATPHISGIATLMYQVKPSLSAKMAKQIICDDKNAVQMISGYKVPNAKLCVEAALKKWDIPASDVNWPTGMVAGSIRDRSGNTFNGTVFHIQAIRHSTGDYNLDRYTFEFLTLKSLS